MSEEFESFAADTVADGPAEAGDSGDVSQTSPSSDPVQSEPVPSGPIKYGEPEPQRPPQPRSQSGQFGAKPKPPNSWRADVAQHWQSLPPPVQEYVNQRETETQRQFTTYGERIRNYSAWDDIANEYKSDFEMYGITDPAQGYRALLNAERAIRADPLNGVLQIAKAYGVDLHAALRGQVAPEAFQQAHQHYQQIEQQRALTETNALVERFKESHPHFESVEAEMMGMIPIIRQRGPGLSQTEVLEKAYESATLAHPETRQRVREEERKVEIERQKAEEHKRLQDAQRRAVEAKTAARLNVRSQATSYQAPKSFDDTISDLARKHYG